MCLDENKDHQQVLFHEFINQNVLATIYALDIAQFSMSPDR